MNMLFLPPVELTSHAPQLLAHFFARQRSDNTRYGYALDLGQFLEFAESRGVHVEDVEQITPGLVAHWQQVVLSKYSVQINGRSYAKATARRKMASLHSFLKFCTKQGVLEKNPVDRLVKPRVEFEQGRDILTAPEVTQLLTWAKKHQFEAAGHAKRVCWRSNAYHEARSLYVALCLLLTVGMRVTELCTLSMQDFVDHDSEPRLVLSVKGGKQHKPMIHPNAAKVLRKYRKEFRASAKEEDPLLVRFYANTERRFHASVMRDKVKRAAEKAGIKKNITPHSCRATLATLLSRRGVQVKEIQVLLNHVSVETTMRYVKIANEKEQSAALKIDLI